MLRVRTPTTEADIAALKFAADRAGTALACIFSSSAEFEADLIRERRAQGAYGRSPRLRGLVRVGIVTALLAIVFLLL
jgi:DNA invertase Pin-like site-specific DNA recombinase